MRRTAIVSRSAAARAIPAAPTPVLAKSAAQSASHSNPPTPSGGMRNRLADERVRRAALWLAWLAVLALALAAFLRPAPRALTQEIIDRAVLKTLETAQLPSPYAKAYETVSPAVVAVRSFVKGKDGQPTVQHGIGTGVVIVDTGIILTNLHVVAGADRIEVVFSDGLESAAFIRNVQPQDDLAVLQAAKIPDDMIAATMRSTADLRPGDQVLAVGFPFGIGPSASGGIVSGLKRSFTSPEGKTELTNLIQFDAAANPGNSGGPLVTMDGEVVGIVTAILNPTPARTFLGIGFAVPIENAASAAGLPPF